MSWKNPGLREKIIIATKVAGPGRSFIDETRYKTLGLPIPSDNEKSLTYAPNKIRIALDASLKRMKITYFDLYQLHWPDRSIPLWGQTLYKKEFHDKNMKSSSLKFQSKELDETILCIGELIKEGKIKAWGLSNETSYGMMMYCEACKRLNVPLPSTIQQDFGLLDRRFEESLVEICSFFNIVLLSYGTLNGGSLSGKYLDRVLDDNESKRLKVDELKQAATEKSRHVSTISIF